jgi:tetratricopeptide (TPR) repeat protein
VARERIRIDHSGGATLSTNDLQFPTPSEGQFEELVLLLVQAIYKPELPAQLVGRRGQNQKGIDVIVQGQDGRWIGVQCKRYLKTKLTAKTVKTDLDSAHDVKPPLSLFIVATRADRDGSLQEEVRQMTLHGKQGTVHVWSWPDLVALLDQHDLAHHLLASVAPKYLLRAYEQQVGPLSLGASASLSVSPAANDPPWLAGINKLLARLKPFTALDQLSAISPAPEEHDAHVIAKIRCLIGTADFGEAMHVAEGLAEPTAVQLAFGAFAAARADDHPKAIRWIERAKASADEKERKQIWSLFVSIAMIVGDRSYEDVAASIPDALLNTREVAQAMGDLASSHDRYEEAIKWFEQAEAQDPGGSLPRQVKLASAKIALAFSRSPIGSLRASHPEDIQLAETGRAVLASIANDLAQLEDPQVKIALLNNLSLAESLLGEAQGAIQHSESALREDLSSIEMWQRYTSMALRTRQELDEQLLLAVPEDAELHFRVSVLYRVAGKFDLALASLKRAQELGFSDDGLETELFRSQHPTPLSDGAAAVLMERLRDGAPAVPLATLVLEHIDDAAMEPAREEALGFIRQMAGRDDLSQEARVLVAVMLRDAGCERDATDFIPVVEQLLYRGEHLDPTTADLLVSLLIAQWRHHRADAVTNEWVSAYPNDINAIVARANVLTARGRYGEFWDFIDSVLERGITTPAVLENYARASILTGRLRRGARRVRGVELPSTRTATAFRRVFFALSVFRDPRLRDLLTEGLTPGRVDASNAAALLGLGLRRFRGSPGRRVSVDTLVTLSAPNRSQRTIWIGTAPSPVPGVVQLDPHTSWASPLVGLGVGEHVTPLSGPLAGLDVSIVDVADTVQLFMKASRDIAVGVGVAEGGADEISAPSVTEMLEQMKAMVSAQDARMNRILSIARERGLPATVMASIFKKPARAFIHKSHGWRPTVHSGSESDQQKDDRAIRSAERFVIDPVAVMTIVQCKAEEILETFGVPVVTPQTLITLRQFYFQERESLQAVAQAQVTPGGKLRFVEVRARERVEHVRYWQGVARFLRTCETVECGSDEHLSSVGHYEQVVDAGLVSSFAVAIERNWTILSEEKGVRDLAAEAGIAHSASLQRLIAVGVDLRPDSLLSATRTLAALASLGGHFTAVPMAVLLAVLKLPSSQRKPTFKALLGSCREATVQSAFPILAGLFVYSAGRSKTDQRRSVSPSWLLKEIVRAMPPIPPGLAGGPLKGFIHEAYPGRLNRRFRRAILRRFVK